MNHTDVGCDNFIGTAQGLRMIDWEKPRVDDCSYDLSCFLSEPAQLWSSPHVLTVEDREAFIERCPLKWKKRRASQKKDSHQGTYGFFTLDSMGGNQAL